MNATPVIIGTWLVAMVIGQCYGAAKFRGGANFALSAAFATGAALIVAGVL